MENQNDHVTKTGSGQTFETKRVLKSDDRFFLP
jgi:hypothetical protein|eukprot:COSAG06_NODE_8222_length_2232_cov_10.556493_2_plen_33_part_00